MALLDTIAARVSAIVNGEYPAAPTDPYITAGTFVAGQVFLPQENARFPGGASKVAADRRYDLVWEKLAFDPPGSENGATGPWVRDATLLLRVQYAIVQPKALAPTDVSLVLGALEAATRKALNDAAVFQWAMLKPGAFSGIAIGVLCDEDATASQADALRAVGITRLRFLKSQPITASPGL